ncbi:unnamed protein product [Didymodactylos carnosus]|uniref:F-box domain-containing protein n=1 Tax=Didymodactylos carnosus TaxID=1234261 RepID=A0A815EM55_9BILA|nr:unnamed protein product [Didymodactylos carnosus]CAF4159885.1 unnamed protein product [Didymodactylos carnosus]
MLLEEIPFEMYLEIFKYLDAINIYYGFYDLNKRINSVLSQMRLCFNYSDKSNDRFASILDTFERQQVYSFTLSSGVIAVFYSMFTLIQFNNLRTLKLLGITNEHLDRIASELLRLKHLTQLHVETLIQTDESYDYNRILQISTLKICLLKLYSKNHLYFSMPLLFNSSIECLTICLNYFDDLYIFLQCMPKLKRLIVNVYTTEDAKGMNNNNISELTVANLVYFKLMIKDYNVDVQIYEPLKELLMHLPKLAYFELLSFCASFRDGHWWKNVLCKLLHLKTFSCGFMVWKRNQPRNIPLFGEQFVESFQTPFWLNERKEWGIRCEKTPGCIYVYTSKRCVSITHV